jgi:selenophosphate synthetase-related protein
MITTVRLNKNHKDFEKDILNLVEKGFDWLDYTILTVAAEDREDVRIILESDGLNCISIATVVGKEMVLIGTVEDTSAEFTSKLLSLIEASFV